MYIIDVVFAGMFQPTEIAVLEVNERHKRAAGGGIYLHFVSL